MDDAGGRLGRMAVASWWPTPLPMALVFASGSATGLVNTLIPQRRGLFALGDRANLSVAPAASTAGG